MFGSKIKKLKDDDLKFLLSTMNPNELTSWVSRFDINKTFSLNGCKTTILHEAIALSSDELVLGLLSLGADPTKNRTALGLPIMFCIDNKRSFELFYKMFLSSKQKINNSLWSSENNFGTNITMAAARHNDIRFVKFFSESGVDMKSVIRVKPQEWRGIFRKQKWVTTCSMEAILYGDPDVAEYLIDLGSKVLSLPEWPEAEHVQACLSLKGRSGSEFESRKRRLMILLSNVVNLPNYSDISEYFETEECLNKFLYDLKMNRQTKG